MLNAKKLVTYFINPLLLLILTVIVTQLLMVENQKLNSQSAVDVDAPRGIGHETLMPLQLSAWEPYYSGGAGTDKVITLSGSALRVSTGADGEWYGARTEIANHEFLSNHSISFAVRVDDWEAVDRVLLLFSTNERFTDYFGVNLHNYFAKPVNSEWNEVVIERSVFEVIEGEPDWSEVKTLGVRVVPKPGFASRVWFDEFKLVAETGQAPIISFTFDDGHKSVVEAAAILNQYGYAGTAFIIPRLLNEEGYMKQTDIDVLHELGWDISGHSNVKLTKMIPSDVDTELALTYAYLAGNGYQGREHFAYPNGAYSESVKSQVLEYFTSARTIDGFSQPTEYAYPQNINAITVSSSTPVTELVRAIDQSVADNSWLIVVWHDLGVVPTEDTEYNIDDFRWLVEYIHESGIEVLPYSTVYNQFFR